MFVRHDALELWATSLQGEQMLLAEDTQVLLGEVARVACSRLGANLGGGGVEGPAPLVQ